MLGTVIKERNCVSTTTRIIFPDEWSKVANAVRELYNAEPPAPEMCLACAVEEKDGEIIGFLFLQLVPHLEPFGSLGGASFAKLKGTIDEFVTSIGKTNSVGYYSHFIDNPTGEAVAVSNGFKPVGMLYFGKPQ